jgi:hypothetical protein
MKSRATEHSKIGHLARKLKIPPVMAVGLMERLWHWAADEIPNGGIGKRGDEIIADKCWWPWPKRAKEFIDALTDVGFLDELDGCGLYIHDWHDHCEDRVHSFLARKGERFANGTIPKLTRLNADEKRRALLAFSGHPCAQNTPDSAGQRGAALDSAQNTQGGAGQRGPALDSALPLACSPLPVASLPVVPQGEGSNEEETEGDEAYRILVSVPELRGLTWLQDRTARQFAPGLDWVKAAERIVKDAMLMTRIENPGAFVKAKYLRLIAETGSEKKEGGAGEPLYVPMAKRGQSGADTAREHRREAP